MNLTKQFTLLMPITLYGEYSIIKETEHKIKFFLVGGISAKKIEPENEGGKKVNGECHLSPLQTKVAFFIQSLSRSQTEKFKYIFTIIFSAWSWKTIGEDSW